MKENIRYLNTFLGSSLGERGTNNDSIIQSQQGSLLQSVHHGLATGRSSILATSQRWPSTNGCSIMAGADNASQWLAPPPNLRKDLRRLGLEYTAADMSLSALYLHELHHRGSGVGGTSDKSHMSSRRGYPPPGGNVATPGKEILEYLFLRFSDGAGEGGITYLGLIICVLI